MTPAAVRRGPRQVSAVREPASTQPVARVAVDVPLAHLDRPFDYLVPASMDAEARPGVRIRVRFAGRLVDGYLLERTGESEHQGRLAAIERVVSAEPVLTPEIAALARAVADRYAGSMADVLRLAIPPRHARVEAAARPEPAPDAEPSQGVAAAQPGSPDGPGGDGAAVADSLPKWTAYPSGLAFLAAVAHGRAARAVWQALPGENWPARLAEAAATAHRAGRGALMIVPDARDLARLDAALTAALPAGSHVVLSADLGPAERYRRFLAVCRGQVRVVAGTRAAAFAPVRDPALLAVFDDGDDLLAEPRAPYPHVRDVLMLRSTQQGAALLIGGYARTAEAQLLVESGWAHPILADRDEVRRLAPRIEAAGDDYAVGADSAAAHARLSPAAFAAARAALTADAPVLVQVPRRGYLPGLACADCRRPARCRHCQGPLALARGARIPGCRWCGRADPNLRCRACGSDRVRATVAGASRTAEEIGRAFPGVRLRTSAGQSVLAAVEAEPAIVVATPGAEPIADGGYGAALLLDGGLLLGRADLRAAEETLRRWMAAAVLVRPASEGGRVVVGADGSIPTVQALVRWDPAWHASLELAARRETGFPPAVAMATIEGPESAVGAALRQSELPHPNEVLGPVPMEAPATGHAAVAEPEVRALIRAPGAQRKNLAAALRVLAAARSAHKDAAVRIRVDPAELG